MSVDEFYFHRRRGLGRWERIGHPLDTCSFLIPVAIALFFKPESMAFWSFVGVALFSCLFVTKDEFVHSQECDSKENWLHAVLFTLHPICLFAIYNLWLLDQQLSLSVFFLVTLGFGIYQTVSWNFTAAKRMDF